MPRVSLFVAIIFRFSLLPAQQYGNEWINYSQNYYKIPVTNEGIYRIYYSQFPQFPFGSMQPKNFQLFYRGQEQYIYVHNEINGYFNPQTDYIEFYARGNDGWLDSALFNPSSAITNPYYSMYTDTMYYFLTYNLSLNNKRVTVETDTLYENYSSGKAQYCITDVLYQNPVAYYYGKTGPAFSAAEGWFDNYFDKGQSVTINIPTPGHINGYSPTYLNVSVASCSNAASSSQYNHHLRISLPPLLFDTSFTGIKTVKKTFVTSQNLFPLTSLIISSIDDLGALTDKMTTAFVTLSYSRDFMFQDAGHKSFTITSTPGPKSYVEIEQLGSNQAVLWDLTNNLKIPVRESSGKLYAVIPNPGNTRKCYISTVESIYRPNVMPVTNYTDYSVAGKNSDYIIITHPTLFSQANIYKNYRISRGYSAYCYNIEQLYDQFSYGVKKHPLSVRNFLRFVSSIYDSVPKYVFLIGKSIHSGGSVYQSFRKNSQLFESCLVPSFGVPSSDNLLATDVLLSGNGKSQDIPIGRLAAVTGNDITYYLNKVTEHESATPDEWMKRILHFGGGVNDTEQTTFENYLKSMEEIITDTLFGGYVHTFLKKTSLPIQLSVADTVHNLINSGCGLLTFFGHGSTTGFDQNIEEPDDYDNRGKYPLLFANSCLAGDIHLPPPQKIAERWVLTPDRGSIGFLASVDLGYASYLSRFSDEFYRQLAYKNYMQGIGRCFADASKNLIAAYGNDEYMINTCIDFTLHGDPAVPLNCYAKPDLVINSGSIGFVPETPTSENDSFYIKIIVTNFGRTVNEPFIINVERTFPNGSIANYSKIFYKCFYKDTFFINIPTDFILGPGVNQFCVFVDSLNWIDEFNETNNTACTGVTIQIEDIIPVHPYEFAIYPNPTVTLKASTGYPFLGTRTYKFQIDTTDLFTQPLATGNVTQAGGVVEWAPPLTLTENTVYFWRVCVVPQSQGDEKWNESSFIYIPGKTGWSQAHFFQYKKNGFEAIDYDRTERKLNFVTAPKGLTCRTVGNAGNNEQFYNTKYFLDAVGDKTSCGAASAIIVAVIDPETLVPWKSDRADYGHADYPKCYSRNVPSNYFVFYTNNDGLDSLALFLNNIVPDGHYILAYTFIHGNFSFWLNSTKNAFMSLGATQFLSLPNNYPYIFYTRKGDGTCREILGTSSTDILNFDTLVPANYTRGYERSVRIGPSTYWKTLNWNSHALENPDNDQVNLSLWGIKNNSDSLNSIPVIDEFNTEINDLYSYIDAAQLPYARLYMHTRDDTLRTPSQLDKWQITYDEAPETAINPLKAFMFPKDTLIEGDVLKFSVATENISNYDMDSLLVKYWIQNRNNQFVNIIYRRLRPHPAGDVLSDTISVSTLGLPGLNHIWYEVNPANPSTGVYDQLEQYHFNNFAEKTFYVSSDITNPLLDVTFDGVHIMNGDIVSSRPYILITLKDENMFLALDDTSDFGVYLTEVSTGIEKRIYFTQSEMLLYTPASLPDNRFKIEFRPILSDGKYQLRVQAKDASSNESGDNDYRIVFEVINKSSITNVFNYPNPFSTSTRFAFLLTGSDLPDDLRIQIITVTGKLVREIRLEELGPLHIGNNLTQFAWNGTDTYGDKLANGVYFYKVIAKIGGESIEHRDTEADAYFKKGFGKMYILR